MDNSPNRQDGSQDKTQTLSKSEGDQQISVPQKAPQKDLSAITPSRIPSRLNTVMGATGIPKANTTPKDSAGETKTKTTKSNLPTIQTKIPTKRATANTPTLSLQSPQRGSTKSIAKTGSQVNSPVWRLEQDTSKSCIKASTSNSLKSPFSVGAGNKIGSIARTSCRSTSNISSKGARSQRNDGSTDGLRDGSGLPKVTSVHGDHDPNNLSARERVAENNKLKVFEILHKKLENMQMEFMQKFEALKLTSSDKLKSDYKFITMIKNDECKLVIADEDQFRLPKRLPVNSMNDFKEKIRKAFDENFQTLFDNLNNEMNSQEIFPNFAELQNKLEKVQRQKLCEIYDNLHDLFSTKNDPDTESKIESLQKELQERKKSTHTLEKKIDDLKKDHAEVLASREKELDSRHNSELMKRDIQIAESAKKLKTMEKQIDKMKAIMHQNNEENKNDQSERNKLQEELKSCKETMHCMSRKLEQADALLAQEKEEKYERAEFVRKIEHELIEAHKKIAELGKTNRGDHIIKNEAQERELTQLRAHVESLEMEKKGLENQVDKMRYDVLTVCDLRNKLTETEDRVRDLQSVLEQRNFESPDKTEIPKELLNELSKLRQSDADRRREMEKLRVELSKAHFNICQLEEQVQRDQQLLDVRSELINSLQSNDNSQRIHLDELFAQVGDKNNTINELNNELRTKSEEFRNLFTTLSTKQLELSRQEHMIKLLEESNERSQMLRVKQEEKIGRMEEEIAQLKHTFSSFNGNHRSNDKSKSLLFVPLEENEDYNENYYYYTSERRRKRQIDINVKKYET